MTKIIFSYGKHVEPNHDKLNAFTEIAGSFDIAVRNVEYDFDSPADERAEKLLKIAQEEVAAGNELILCGTSMGCYGSLLVSQKVKTKGLFLISPAIFMPAYKIKDYPLNNAGLVQFVVGWNDTVIPVDEVEAFAKKQKIETHFVNDNHAMPDSLDVLKVLFEAFLRKL